MILMETASNYINSAAADAPVSLDISSYSVDSHLRYHNINHTLPTP